MPIDSGFLKRVPLFADLHPQDLLPIADLFTERRYEPGNVIFFENETGDYFYIVYEGQVKAMRQLADGREAILALHDAGEFFGEMALLDGETTPATVVAVRSTRVWSTDKRGFLSMLENASVQAALVRILCRRCRDAWSQVQTLTLQHAKARVRAVLYRLAQSKGVEGDDGVEIPFKLPHREIASMAGLARESTSRAISELQRAGQVASKGENLLVPAPEALLEEDESA